jgi:hypothetical protein
VSAPVYTRRLCATRGLANTTTVCFIAGVGTTVLRDIFIDATQEAGMNTYVLILRLTGGGDYFLVNSTSSCGKSWWPATSCCFTTPVPTGRSVF